MSQVFSPLRQIVPTPSPEPVAQPGDKDFQNVPGIPPTADVISQKTCITPSTEWATEFPLGIVCKSLKRSPKSLWSPSCFYLQHGQIDQRF
jgi:hypothetical protein